MQSLKIQQQYKTNPTPVARISPLIINKKLSSNEISKLQDKDEGWLSCEELETIEKRFNDLLQEPTQKKSILINNYQQQQQRAKSCDRLAIADEVNKLTLSCGKLNYQNLFLKTFLLFSSSKVINR
jgi:hypothetical protein